MTTDGSNPKLTISASESNSLPMGEPTFNILAAKPSKKSKAPAIHTKYAAGKARSSNTNTTPRQPHNRLQHVKKLGRCFIILLYEDVIAQNGLVRFSKPILVSEPWPQYTVTSSGSVKNF